MFGMNFEFSATHVALQIDRFVNRRIGNEDWNLFLEGNWPNPKLERLRKECLAIRTKYPPNRKEDWCNAKGVVELTAIRDRLGIPNRIEIFTGVVLIATGTLFIIGGPVNGLLNLAPMQIRLLFFAHLLLGLILILDYFRRCRRTQRRYN
jgi:hypothetical protein